MTLDYTYERRLELTKRDYREEGRQEGMREGIKEGKLKQLLDLASEGLLQVSVAAKKANMSEDEFEKLLKN